MKKDGVSKKAVVSIEYGTLAIKVCLVFIFLFNFFLKRFFLFLFMYVIQNCFICRPSDSTVSENAGIAPRTVATLALTARRSHPSARSHPQLDLISY